MPSAPRSSAGVALEGKLHPPRLAPGSIPRHKLLALLEQAPHWRVLLLRAPAGYGKTTLMGQLFAQLACQPGTSCHWLTLDPRDDDPLHLLTHLQAAMERHGDGADGAADAPVPDLGLWLNTVARRSGGAVLFLDEFESVRGQATVQLIHQLLRFAPANLRVVVSTRPHARLALHRLKASGWLLEWDARQLRFDDEETRALLRHGDAARTPAAWLELLAQRCEGWPAALRLGTLALHHGEAPPRFLDTLHDGGSDLASYLASEILEQQPPAHRDFLLDTSILRYLLPPLCDALCERGGSAALLEDMGRQLQFLTPLGPSQGGAWRCHSLLQDFLRKRLDALHPGRAALLHRKAAAWLEAEGLLIEAIGHALDSGDAAFAAAMVARAARPLVRSGHLATLQHWIARLPAHIADGHPGIVWAAGRAHTYFHQLEEARARLRQLLALSTQQDFDRLTWEDYLALEALLAAAEDDVAQTMQVTQRNLPQARGDYARGIMLNVRAHGEIARHHFDAALALLDQADLHNRKASNLFGLSAALGLRAAIWSSRGALQRALACYSGMGTDGQHAQHAALGSGLRCELLYETDQLDALQALLALHAPHADDYLATDLVIGAYLAAARLQFARGDGGGAQAILDEALARSLQRRFHRLEFACRWEKVRLATLAGQLAQARALVPAALPGEGSFHFATDTEACDIAWLRLQVRDGQARQALPAIAQHGRQARATQRGWRALKLSVLRACALGALGDAPAAHAALAAALAEGSRHGFVRSFADEGAPVLGPIAAWLAPGAALPAGVPREYAQQVLAAGALPPAAPAAVEVDEGFSARERALLQALAQGQQNREIASRQGLSENTVKWYLKRLYLKLDARNRAQAIAQARRLRLID